MYFTKYRYAEKSMKKVIFITPYTHVTNLLYLPEKNTMFGKYTIIKIAPNIAEHYSRVI